MIKLPNNTSLVWLVATSFFLVTQTFAGIDCPPDMTVNCWVPLDDLDKLGTASWDFEGVNAPIEYEDLPQSDYVALCNYGTVDRRWFMELTGDECIQTITLELSNPFDESQITWPDDATLDCWSDDYDDPIYDKLDPCEFIGLNTKQDTFYNITSACALIEREHTIVNWCENEEFKHVQRIYILDQTNPEIVAQDTTYFVDESCVSAVNFSFIGWDTIGPCASDFISWQVFVDLWGDWSVDYEFSSFISPFDPNFGTPLNELYIEPSPSGQELSITLPELLNGTKYIHRIVVKASDGCNNVKSQTYYFTVEDDKAPTPYCLETLVVNMGHSGVEVWASDFEIDSYDNCADTSQLRYSFGLEDYPDMSNQNYDHLAQSTSLVIDCTTVCDYADSTSISRIPLNVSVWDEFDNRDDCEVTLLVPNSGCGCEGCGFGVIHGKMVDISNEPLEENGTVILDLEGEQNDVILTTNQSGFYNYNWCPSLGNEITYEFYLDIPLSFGLSTLDIVLIQHHILGMQDLNEVQISAGDVTLDGVLSAKDLAEIRKVIVGAQNSFSLNQNVIWHLMPTNTHFERINFNTFRSNDYLMDLPWVKAIKLGDINGSWGDGLKEDEADTRERCILKGKDLFLQKGNRYTVQFNAATDGTILGFQAAFNSPDLSDFEWEASSKLAGLAHDDGNTTSGSYTSFDGSAIEFSENEPLFQLSFTSNTDGYLSESLHLDAHFDSEVYDQAFETFDLHLSFDDPSLDIQERMDIGPNPTSDYVTITNRTNEGIDYTLAALNGQIISRSNLGVGASKDLLSENVSGTYILSWTMGGQVYHQKILKSR